MKRILCLFPLALLCLFSNARPVVLTPDFTYSLDPNSCPLKVTFGDFSWGGTVVSRTWDFGDGGADTAKVLLHTYATAGEYTVKLVVTDNLGQKDSVSQQVTITPVLRYIPLRDTVLKAGGLQLWSRANAETYTWSNGDTTATTTVTQSGTYTVTLNRCGTTVVDSAYVLFQPLDSVDMDVFMPADVCSQLVRFKVVSNIPGDSVIATLWKYGESVYEDWDHRGTDTVRHLFEEKEYSYTVTCRAYLSNGSTYVDVIRVIRLPRPLKPIYPLFNQGSCSIPGPLLLDAGNDRIGATYLWSTDETTQKITMAQPGTYTVAIRDQCGSPVLYPDAQIQGRVQLPKPVLYWTGYALRLQPVNLTFEFLVKWYKNGTLIYTGGGPLEGEINPLYYTFDPGTYQVVISSPLTDCGNESDLYVQNVILPRMSAPTAGTPQSEEFLGEIKVFPNPGNGRFYLKTNHAPVNKTTYTVTDLAGRVISNGVWTDNPQLINLENRPKGIYILKIQSDKLDETVKLIVQ